MFLSEVLRSVLLVPVSDDGSPFSKIHARASQESAAF